MDQVVKLEAILDVDSVIDFSSFNHCHLLSLFLTSELNLYHACTQLIVQAQFFEINLFNLTFTLDYWLTCLVNLLALFLFHDLLLVLGNSHHFSVRLLHILRADVEVFTCTFESLC